MLKRRHERTGRRAAPAGWKVPTRWLLTASALSLFGCPDEELAPLEPCTVSGVSRDIPVSGVDKVDLLFVIDNSGSMKEEQARLADQLPELVRILTSGDYEGDGMDEFNAVADLHLGVVTSDMGTSGNNTDLAPCIERELRASTEDRTVVGYKNGEVGFGDDGILVSESRDSACNFSLNGPRYLTYVPGTSAESPEQIAANFKCLASLGINGCGIEQQLEAMYKALAPDSVSFAGNTRGHGNGRNAGFLRDDAVLAVIQVSDEEDCSITDSGADLFSRDTDHPDLLLPGGKPIGLNLRCAYRDSATATELRVERLGMVHPVERYIDGLKALKPDNPDRVIFGAIVGIPVDMEGKPFDEILAADDMQFKLDPNRLGMGDPADVYTQPAPACYSLNDATGAVETDPTPALRFVKTAKGFGENGVVRSICAKNYSSALTAIVDKISKQLTGACLPRPLSPNSEGVVECKVVEILPRGATPQSCNAANGRVFLEPREIDGEQRVVCEINQVPVKDGKPVPNPNSLPDVPEDVGWYYDDFTPELEDECPANARQRISFRPESAKPSNSTVRIECFQPVARNDPAATGKQAVNMSCAGDKQRECEDRSDPEELVNAGRGYRLTCEQNTQTCQIVCAADVNCPTGWVCDKGTGQEQGLCVLPTCPPPATK